MRIEIINGSVEYDGNTVLSEINFSVSDKEKIALVGRNGSGKTSILKCIGGEVPLVSGTGDEKFSFSISGAPKIGYLQQVSLNDELTLRQEILCGRYITKVFIAQCFFPLNFGLYFLT